VKKEEKKVEEVHVEEHEKKEVEVQEEVRIIIMDKDWILRFLIN